MKRRIHSLSLYFKIRKTNIKVTSWALFKRFKLPNQPIRIEDYSYIDQSFVLHSIGAYSYTHSSLSQTSTIGRYCSIARNVQIMENNHPLDRFTTSPITYHKKYKGKFNLHDIHDEEKSVHIEHDVWIGESVTLKRGIRVGTGAVIGYGALVTKNVPPYSVVAGVPARIIRYRYSKEIIDQLLDLKWWQYDLSKYNLSPTCTIEDFLHLIRSIEHEYDDFETVTL